MNNDEELLEIDLHDLALWQAKKKIIENIQKAIRKKGLYLIHGYIEGNKIKNYIRNGPLENSLIDRGYEVKIRTEKDNPGVTIVTFHEDANE